MIDLLIVLASTPVLALALALLYGIPKDTGMHWPGPIAADGSHCDPGDCGDGGGGD